jgi:hypothetical protein
MVGFIDIDVAKLNQAFYKEKLLKKKLLYNVLKINYLAFL